MFLTKGRITPLIAYKLFTPKEDDATPATITDEGDEIGAEPSQTELVIGVILPCVVAPNVELSF